MNPSVILPSELVVEIFSFLEVKDVVEQCSLVRISNVEMCSFIVICVRYREHGIRLPIQSLFGANLYISYTFPETKRSFLTNLNTAPIVRRLIDSKVKKMAWNEARLHLISQSILR